MNKWSLATHCFEALAFYFSPEEKDRLLLGHKLYDLMPKYERDLRLREYCHDLPPQILKLKHEGFVL